MFRHVFAYVCSYFRKWEISRSGKIDINGVYRAKIEYYLHIIEIIIDCMIMGFAFNHLWIKSSIELHSEPFKNYWILIDCVIMMFTIPYLVIIQKLRFESETERNIFTLSFVHSNL